MTLELVPAIDLLDGRVVRLHQGDYARVTVYAEDALAEAARFRDAGARRLHVVDLEGARTKASATDGARAQRALVERIVRETALEVQVGGGVRSPEVARAWLDAGAARVVIGTAVVREPAWVSALARERASAVVAALDARDGEVRIAGWLEGSGRRVEDVARECDGWGVGAILFTDIGRDGTGAGPAVDATATLQRAVRCDVIASGGIGSLEHVEALARAGVREAVCGRALYEGAFDYAAAVRLLEGLA
ncbi:MAG: 1-(5-phosphoribosyl)-5-((5-phosphoribosylamino)methylideneamino)imidazole-4-carboxamide isomerase [Sandaracinaceae bacterium]|nr:1-(5-phosphoribosyl)-5-((5-phosphoribosylamino)methylideneamino)imidazole-4-carboxamide isomerase [Sandaracinaceae bacterium]